MPLINLKSLHDIDATDGTVQLRAQLRDEDIMILVPHPTANDPNDPLRWPRWKKHAAFASVCSFTFLTNYAIGGLAPAFYVLSRQFQKSQTETSDLLLWPILVLGVFNFVWVPLGNYFGKRPVWVFCSLLLTLAYVWGAVAQSFESLLWSNIVAAFAGSSTEALGASIVNDLYFLHERSTFMSIYMNAICGGNTIGPLICGFVITGLGWRWHKWIAAILTGVNFLCIVFFVPEVRYVRDVNKAMGADGTASPTASSELNLEDEEKKVVTAAKTLSSRYDSVEQIPKKTWMQEMSLYSGAATNINLLESFIRPWPLVVYPAVIFAFLGYAITLAWVVAINILSIFVLQAPPYNWKPSINGLINIPGLLGNVFGAIVAGWCVDRYSVWRSRRSGGLFQPEWRLVAIIVPALIVPAGCILFGYGVAETLHWITLFFGCGMISVGLTAVPVIGMTYVSDCYFAVSTDALLLINGLKNIVAFGFLWGVIPWVQTVGYIDTYWTQAAIMIFFSLFAIPLYYFGARLRHTSAKWRLIL